MWLINHSIKIKCIKVTPYTLGDQILIDTEQIIPIQDAEDYLMKLANKKQEELMSKEKNQTRHSIRINFWTKLLEEMNGKSDLFKNISPSKDNWIGCGSGHSGLAYMFVVTGNYARIELWINRGMQEENKELFDSILNHKDKIEVSFGDQLDWQRLDAGKGSRIAYWLKDVSVFNEEDWAQMINFMTSNMIKLEKALKNILRDVIKK